MLPGLPVVLLLSFTGDTLFQMAEVHRQIQVQLEDVVRLSTDKNHCGFCSYLIVFAGLAQDIFLNYLSVHVGFSYTLACVYCKLSKI